MVVIDFHLDGLPGVQYLITEG